MLKPCRFLTVRHPYEPESDSTLILVLNCYLFWVKVIHIANNHLTNLVLLYYLIWVCRNASLEIPYMFLTLICLQSL